MQDFEADYLAYAEPQTSAPLVLHKAGALAALSSAVEGRVWFQHGANRIRPNLYMILVASSSFHRKSTALNIARRLAESAGAYSLPADFSREKFMSLLADKPQATIWHSEFGSLLGLLSRDYMSGTTAFLTDIFDGYTDFRREVQGRSYEIKNPCLSIFAASTLDWLVSQMREGDFYGGFLPRFLIVPTKEKVASKAFPDTPNLALQQNLKARLTDIRLKMVGEMNLHIYAKNYYSEWFAEYEGKHALGRLASWYTRLETAVFKLAMLYELGNNVSMEITLESMGRATTFISELTVALDQIFSEGLGLTRDERDLKKVKSTIREHKIIDRATLLRNTHLTARRLEELTKTMLEREEVEVEYKKDSKVKGRSKTFYRWIPGHKAFSPEDTANSQGLLLTESSNKSISDII